MAGVWHLKRIWKDAFSVAGTVQETCSSELLRGPGFFLEYQTVRFAEMILRDRCSTSYDLAVVGAVLLTGGVEKSQHAFVRGRQLCTQLSIFEGRLAKLLCFDVVNFKKWGRLAELLRFWCCQVQKLRNSCRFMLSSSKTEEVSQKIHFQAWR